MKPLLPLFAAAAALALGAAPALADAAATYEAQCTRCHGADGKGETPAGKALKVPSLVSGDVAALDADALAAAIHKVPQHKAFLSKLSEEEIASLASYVDGMGGAP